MKQRRYPNRIIQTATAIYALSLFAGISQVWAEEITLTTFYPSPKGVYEQLETTGETSLATDGESFVGIGTDSPAAELDIRHDNPDDENDNRQTTVHLSSNDQHQVAINLFTKGEPVSKNLSGQTGIKAWHMVAKGNDRQTQNTDPNDERNHLKFSFYDGDADSPGFINTMSLGPGKVGIKRLHPEYELDVNGSLGIGDSSQSFGSAEILSQTPPNPYSALTTFRSGNTPDSGTAKHAFYFRTRDESGDTTTRKTVPDVFIDGQLTAAENVVLTSTGHTMQQTGFVTGTYTGNGTSNRVVNLGFQPRFVKIWSQSLGSGFINASVFEKTAEMPGGFAVYSFSEHAHQSVPGGSPTRNEDTIGRTFTYYFDVSLNITSDGFQVSGTDNTASVSGYFETNGLAPDDSGLQYFYIAYR